MVWNGVLNTPLNLFYTSGVLGLRPFCTFLTACLLIKKKCIKPNQVVLATKCVKTNFFFFPILALSHQLNEA